MRRILVRLDTRHKAARDFLGGILHYAAFHSEWDVRIAGGHPKNESRQNVLDWHPDGMVTDRALSTALIDTLCRSGLRGLILSYGQMVGIPCRRRLAVRRIVCDNDAVGRAGADFLLRRGMRHLAFVPEEVPDEGLAARCRAFVRVAAEHGVATSVFAAKASEAELADWIVRLPKPCGIMAAFDQRAKNVLDACRSVEVKIPEQILLLGVDDETYICENTLPTLTSILPDFSGAGFHAAEALDEMLEEVAEPDDHASLSTWSYGVSKIVERVSTADVSGTARGVALATDYMRREYASIRDVSSVAKAVGTSVRLLEKHFRSVLGSTVVRELQRVRLENVKRLLADTDRPFVRIAEACGFENELYLKALFRRCCGETMSAYRKRCRPSGREIANLQVSRPNGAPVETGVKSSTCKFHARNDRLV